MITMRKNIIAGILPNILMIIWAVYELLQGINYEQNSRIFISALFILFFIVVIVISLVKVVKYPNDPTYLKKK
ncbi:hypothetical protein GCM10010984_26730 [Chishuiella changwenlii]|uniref:Uncharacterized protein n=2 Tax=Chishuiella changwenlii TaxID=1434701 RepID=A0ABQ1U2T4_9FLAO|nr:hypothetical protein GCM10010984_26730 [Chishuiella changwenlii]